VTVIPYVIYLLCSDDKLFVHTCSGCNTVCKESPAIYDAGRGDPALPSACVWAPPQRPPDQRCVHASHELHNSLSLYIYIQQWGRRSNCSRHAATLLPSSRSTTCCGCHQVMQLP
jgi:hypothetical protein